MKNYIIAKHLFTDELKILSKDEYDCTIGPNYEPIDDTDEKSDAELILKRVKLIGVDAYLEEVKRKTFKKTMSRDEIVIKMRTLRQQTGWSQREFANYMGLPLQTLQHWEQGKSVLTESYVNIIERCLIAEGILKGKVMYYA